MILSVHQNRIRRAFSQSAGHYEQLAGLQERLGQELMSCIPSRSFRRILDIGMGTGRLTDKLKRRWPGACVTGVDFASGMVQYAGRCYPDVRFIQADAAWLPFHPGSIDLAFSNLVYQWVDDLGQAFGRVHRILGPGGCFYLNIFTRGSLKELLVTFEDLGQRRKGTGMIGIRRLPDFSRVERAVAGAGFRVRARTRRTERVYFDNMIDLLRWLKGIGAQAAPRDFFVGRDMIKEAEACYRMRFSAGHRIYVTFEVGTIIAPKDREVKEHDA